MLADEARVAAQRQRFIGRERWNAARHAARRVTEVTGTTPLVLGGVAAVSLLYSGPESRLRRRIELLVPEPEAAAARLAVADIRGVRIVSRVLPGRRRAGSEEALWLRSSPITVDGWRVPTLEDLVLLSAMDLMVASGARRMAVLSDLRLALDDGHLHWETVVQRASVWRVRVAMHGALREMRDDLGVRVPERLLRRLRPGLIERAAELLPRP